MYGVTELSIDSKGRIILPSFTYAEKDEELVLVKMSEENFYIVKSSYLDLLVNAIEAEVNPLLPQEQYKLLEERLVSLCLSVRRKLSVDGTRRVILGKDFADCDKVQVVGLKDKIALIKK